MERLADDELCQILSRVTDPDDRKSTSEVCKGWWLMEGLSRSSLRVLNLIHLPRILSRYPNLTTFQTHKGMSDADLALVARSCPKLEAIILDAMSVIEEIREIGVQDLGALQGGRGGDEIIAELGISSDDVWKKLGVIQQVGNQGLCALADGCPNLSKIVINRIEAGLHGIMVMITSAAHNLTHLDLEHCGLVTDQALETVGSSSCSIRFLNLRFCCYITDVGLRFLANGSCSKTIKQLHLSGCYEITNDGVSLLRKMCVLEELDLRSCYNITDVGGQAISTIRTLKKLNLACLFMLREETFLALAKNCINLEVLNLQQCQVTAESIDAFFGSQTLVIR